MDVGSEEHREVMSPGIQPKIDLERRNSTENPLKKFKSRSKSLSNLRSNLGFFQDTTEKKMANNKFRPEESLT